jgi:3-(3-hydroxy-phenyl)propionate hydroxylase
MAQGMVQGMRDALNLAWKLERIVRGRSSPDLLDTYQQERRPHVVTTTRTAMELGRVICERDPVRARERDARLLAEQGGQVTTQFRQNMIPGLHAGLTACESPGAGCILPQPMIKLRDKLMRLDDLTGRTVRVVTHGDLPASDQTLLLDALQPLGGVLVLLGATGDSTADVIHALEDEPVLVPWLGQIGRRFVVARPDHCVFGTAASLAQTISLLAALRDALA